MQTEPKTHPPKNEEYVTPPAGPGDGERPAAPGPQPRRPELPADEDDDARVRGSGGEAQRPLLSVQRC